MIRSLPLRFLGRYRTRDGPPQPKIETFHDLLRARDEQLVELRAGRVSLRLFRVRIRRWCQRFKTLCLQQEYDLEQRRKDEERSNEQ